VEEQVLSKSAGNDNWHKAKAPWQCAAKGLLEAKRGGIRSRTGPRREALGARSSRRRSDAPAGHESCLNPGPADVQSNLFIGTIKNKDCILSVRFQDESFAVPRALTRDLLMSQELPSEYLLARVAQHDVDALGELYDRYAPCVYGLVAHIHPWREAAEEILREVFLRLFRESPSLNQEGRSVAAWLVVTARAAAVERLRALGKNALSPAPPGSSVTTERGRDTRTRKSKAAILVSSMPTSSPGKAEALKLRVTDGAGAAAMGLDTLAWLPHPKEIALIDDRLVLLHKAINQLPKPQREALELAVFRGLRESEIAAEMGEPLGRVRSSLRAAMTFIKHRRRAVCGTWAANI
jgi:RNA polymerase sigma-70 factor (ECF subfamily)